MTDISTLIGDYQVFLNKLLGYIQSIGINFTNLGFAEIDHIVYRFADINKYESFKARLAKFVTFVD